MKKKERYVVERVSIGFWFPETFCELKDTESEFYVLLKNMDVAIKIKDLLNQKDKRIKELKEEVLDKLCYLEEISYEFGQAVKNKVEGLKK